VRALEEAVQKLSALGHELVPFHPHSSGAVTWEEMRGVAIAMGALGHDESKAESKKTDENEEGERKNEEGEKVVGSYGGGPLDGETMHPDLVAMYTPPPKETQSAAAVSLPHTTSPQLLQSAIAARDDLRDKFGRAWRDHQLDVVLCPAWSYPAPPVEEVRNLTWSVRTTQVFNILDYPAGVVPVTLVTTDDAAAAYEPATDDVQLAQAAIKSVRGSVGLPVGLQLVAPPWEEELCLHAMSELSRVMPFDHTQHARLQPTPRRPAELGGPPEALASL
jgi:fatty acid amide hydrolase